MSQTYFGLVEPAPARFRRLQTQGTTPSRDGFRVAVGHWSGRSSLRFLTIAALLLAAGCGNKAPPTDANAEKPAAALPILKAVVTQVESRPWETIVRTQGSLVADEVSVVGSRVAGRVAETLVDLGDIAQAGEPLVRLDDAEFQLHVVQGEAQLAQARAAVGLKTGDPVEKLEPENSPPVRQEKALWDEAKANLKRARDLLAKNALTAAEIEQIEAAERVADARYASAMNSVREKIALISVRMAEVSQARQQLSDAIINAPFTGLVEQRHVAPGAYVKVGDPIVTLVRANPLRFRGTMPERHARELAIGEEVRLKIESVDEPLVARVSRISPALDVLSRGLLFEALVENGDGQLRTGLFAEAEVVLNSKSRAIVVPQSAVAEFAGAEKVWAVVDGTSREQLVVTGQRRGDWIEILEGVEPGQSLLLNADQGKVARIEPQSAPATGVSQSRAAEPHAAGSE